MGEKTNGNNMEDDTFYLKIYINCFLSFEEKYMDLYELCLHVISII